MLRLSISASVIAVTLAVSTVAHADGLNGSAPEPISVPVSYSDLDVRTFDGAGALKARIERAAGVACGGAPYIIDLKAQLIYRQCKDEAVARAVTNSGMPALVALYNGSERPVAFAQR